MVELFCRAVIILRISTTPPRIYNEDLMCKEPDHTMRYDFKLRCNAYPFTMQYPAIGLLIVFITRPNLVRTIHASFRTKLKPELKTRDPALDIRRSGRCLRPWSVNISRTPQRIMWPGLLNTFWIPNELTIYRSAYEISSGYKAFVGRKFVFHNLSSR